ncbi:MAG TPA: low affinity iron permease family protein [Actinomycetota bacterium]|nr:low affinity iron permease family protein [Actinomycetota bacterium]
MLDKLIDRVSDLIGSQGSAVIAVLLVVASLIAGQATGYSERWEQIVLVGSALLTLIIVVAIHHTRGKEHRASQIKLDELIRALESARNDVRSTERASRDELEEIRERTHPKERNQA